MPEQRLPPELRPHRDAVLHRLRALAATVPDPAGAPIRRLAATPGKMLRACLLGACARLGPHDTERAVRLGAVVELLHLASLLHDDVVDRAELRRGAPSAYAAAGGELATLAGLACFALAGTEAVDLGEVVHRTVSEAVAELAYGELLDVERAFDAGLSITDYLELVERKTGELFRLACLLGAAEAEVTAATAGALARFGLDLGVAFQVLDDCLDLQSPEAGTGTTGKPAGTDHLLGLFGAPVLFALANDHTGELSALLRSPTLSVPDTPAVRALVDAGGGLTAARALARERYAEALGLLDAVADAASRRVLAGTAALSWPEP
jgi:heptaprenyl diphosphate synthase